MGLDMYFSVKNKDKTQEIFRWRKANQIRYWFARRFDQDLESQIKVEVTSDDILVLVSDIRAVLLDHKKAERLLPTEPGFFFGSTDYDKYYFEDLEETIDFFINELPTLGLPKDAVFEYSEWW